MQSAIEPFATRRVWSDHCGLRISTRKRRRANMPVHALNATERNRWVPPLDSNAWSATEQPSRAGRGLQRPVTSPLQSSATCSFRPLDGAPNQRKQHANRQRHHLAIRNRTHLQTERPSITQDDMQMHARVRFTQLFGMKLQCMLSQPTVIAEGLKIQRMLVHNWNGTTPQTDAHQPKHTRPPSRSMRTIRAREGIGEF